MKDEEAKTFDQWWEEMELLLKSYNASPKEIALQAWLSSRVMYLRFLEKNGK